jgi:hypothetical protein
MSRSLLALASLLVPLCAACGSSSDADGMAGAGASAGMAAGGAQSSAGGGSSSTAGKPGGGTSGKADAGESAGAGESSGAGTSAGGEGANPMACQPDSSEAVPQRALAGVWQKIEIPGLLCGNGSQYKFFVNYSSDSNNLLISFEPGGACWDYASCAGDGGLRGAANPDGIPDNHMSSLKWEMLPLHRRDPINPLQKWNMIFVPYCTGDLHTGNNVITYPNPTPEGEPLLFHHDGHKNVMAIIDWANKEFANIPQLLVTGCSAGGTSSLVNYHFIRKGLSGAQCSYMLDDSGPLFPSAGNSGPLHKKVRESWNLDPVIDQAISTDFPGVSADDVKKDLSLVNTALADKYPQDRLAVALYRLDYNYSLYSYERFYDMHAQADIHRMWWEDIQGMMKLFVTRPNLAYFIPYYRNDNCSHCMTIPPIDSGVIAELLDPYKGSEIQAASLNIRDYVEHLVDDSQPLQSYLEDAQTGEELTPERAAECSAL